MKIIWFNMRKWNGQLGQDFKKILYVTVSEKCLGFVTNKPGDLMINSIMLFANH